MLNCKHADSEEESETAGGTTVVYFLCVITAALESMKCGMLHRSFSESRHSLCSAEREESASADIPKAYTCSFEGKRTPIYNFRDIQMSVIHTTCWLNT